MFHRSIYLCWQSQEARKSIDHVNTLMLIMGMAAGMMYNAMKLFSNVYDACVCVCACAHVCVCACVCGSFVLFSVIEHF